MNEGNRIPIPAWVISFAESDALRFSSELSSLGVQVNWAPAQRDDARDQWPPGTVADDVFEIRTGVTFGRGVIGCALSHRSVYERMVADDIPWALVLEDDAEPTDFVPSLPDVVCAIYETSSPTIAQLCTRGFRVLDSRQGVVALGALRLFRFRFPPGQTVAYLINLAAAKRLLTGPVDGPADWPLAASGISFLGAFPWLFRESGRTSTIAAHTDVTIFWRLKTITGWNALTLARRGYRLDSVWRCVMGPYMWTCASRIFGLVELFGPDGPALNRLSVGRLLSTRTGNFSRS